MQASSRSTRRSRSAMRSSPKSLRVRGNSAKCRASTSHGPSVNGPSAEVVRKVVPAGPTGRRAGATVAGLATNAIHGTRAAHATNATRADPATTGIAAMPADREATVRSANRATRATVEIRVREGMIPVARGPRGDRATTDPAHRAREAAGRAPASPPVAGPSIDPRAHRAVTRADRARRSARTLPDSRTTSSRSRVNRRDERAIHTPH